MKKFMTMGLFMAALTGCSIGVYNGDFDCPAPKGMGCTSLSEVNALVSEGHLGDWRKSRILPAGPDEVLPSSHCLSCKHTQ